MWLNNVVPENFGKFLLCLETGKEKQRELNGKDGPGVWNERNMIGCLWGERKNGIDFLTLHCIPSGAEGQIT